jgi:mannose-6-phosphate isomerase-like protein (cupin superfamily)
MSFQSPGQLCKLNITSTPAGAKISVNGRDTNQKTDTAFVVSPGTYTITVSGDGKVDCENKAVQINAGQSITVHCSETGWTESPS